MNTPTRLAIASLLVSSLLACEKQTTSAPAGNKQAPAPASSDAATRGRSEPAPATQPDAAPPAAKEPEVNQPRQMNGGLIVEDLVIGTGKVCPRGATVKIHYRGTLTNGTEFDSSYSRNEPAEFPLPNLIPGWQEGIPGMKVGGKRKLTVPYQMAYGERDVKDGNKVIIPAKSTLIFEVELLDVR